MIHLGFRGEVERVSEQEPLVYVAVVLFVVDQAKVKLERANHRIRHKLLGITHFQFGDIIKYFFRAISKVKEENLIERRFKVATITEKAVV